MVLRTIQPGAITDTTCATDIQHTRTQPMEVGYYHGVTCLCERESSSTAQPMRKPQSEQLSACATHSRAGIYAQKTSGGGESGRKLASAPRIVLEQRVKLDMANIYGMRTSPARRYFSEHYTPKRDRNNRLHCNVLGDDGEP